MDIIFTNSGNSKISDSHWLLQNTNKIVQIK